MQKIIEELLLFNRKHLNLKLVNFETTKTKNNH